MAKSFHGMKGARVLSICLVLMATPVSFAFGQMFSVQEEKSRPLSNPSAFVRAGIGFNDFSYNGSNGGDQPLLDYSGTHLNLSLELPGLSVFSSFGGEWSGLEDRRSVLFGARLSNAFRLFQGGRFGMFLPGEVQTDVQRVFADFTSMDFQQSSLRLGLGLGSSFQRPGFVIYAEAVPSLGFSYSQGSLYGGYVRGLRCEFRFIERSILERRALFAGYRFTIREYDVDQSLYDYTSLENSFTIGVGF